MKTLSKIIAVILIAIVIMFAVLLFNTAIYTYPQEFKSVYITLQPIILQLAEWLKPVIEWIGGFIQ